jgi:HSP20 family protein
MSMTVTADPPFSNLARQANKLMEQMTKGYYNFCPGDAWTPSVNLYETATAYLVCVDLAGVDKEKIDVEIRDNRLRLSGARHVPQPEPEELGEAAAAAGEGQQKPQQQPQQPKLRVHLMEIDHGTFCRDVELPLNVDREHIEARYRKGMLWVEIPKA